MIIMKTEKNELIKKAKRIVIKIGTSILTDIIDGKPVVTTKNIEPIINSIIPLMKNKTFTIVSSGAIGFGMAELGLNSKPKELSMKQAAAAIGQNKLMQMYDCIFNKRDVTVAQILLTQTGIMQRSRYLNAINTLNSLFKLKVVPIINENDTVAVEEIKFGDNDKLAAMVSSMIEADLLILLTNIDGLLEDVSKPETLISDIRDITSDILKLCGAAGKSTTTGGMKAKLAAADICMSSGIPMIICNTRPDSISKIFDATFKGTFFYPKKKVIPPKKRWIKFNLKPRGRIVVDTGAEKAVLNHKSLLPSGITSFEGRFDVHDCVAVYNLSGEKIAVGLINFDDNFLKKIVGLKMSELKEKYGAESAREIIHIDNMALME